MKVILFVCTANIARSPIAEAIFNHKMMLMGLENEFRAESAGTWAVDGIPASQDGKQVMQNRGLSTSEHRSRNITKGLIEGSDLILTMEAGHKEALQFEFPEKRRKIFLVSEMAGLCYDIPDPYMQGLEKYEETDRELEHLLDQGIERIFKLANEAE